MVTKSNVIVIAILIVISLCSFFLFLLFTRSNYLTFSDAAKYADVAKNIVNGNGYGTSFSFFTESGLVNTDGGLFSARWISPVYPAYLSLFFLIFGISDQVVFLASALAFVAAILILYFLTSKMFGSAVALITGVAVTTSHQMLDLATNGGNETLFIALILLSMYFALLNSKTSVVMFILSLIALYFTRPHAPIYILGLIILKLIPKITNLNKKSVIGVIILMTLLVSILLIDSKFVDRVSISILSSAVISSPSDALRGNPVENASVMPYIPVLIKKVFYNLYNFYRLLPQIMSPYLFGFFILGLFLKQKHKWESYIKVSILVMVIGTFISTALTIPYFRYLHPVIPLVYMLAVATLYKILNKRFVLSLSLILLFVTIQTSGIIFLDSRSQVGLINDHQPPSYVLFSKELKNNTNTGSISVTNLDTWGSWYGDRKTIWFPLEPNMLESVIDRVDYIYLTNYKIDDENYYMGEKWREIFNNPQNHNNEFFNENFEYVDEFTVPASETYENQEGRAVLWRKKN